MRLRNSLLIGAIAALVTTSAPSVAQAACAGAKLQWHNSDWSGCYAKGSHDLANKTSKKITVSSGYKATLHFRGTKPNGDPVTRPDTYGSGTHTTPMHDNNLIEIVVRKA
ncbi:hypothetical protein [Allokutzneria oryzae]|uniref:Uncharacterized protein n=1 Tax=Allokutzneria oryzae TaxID=1378989 RepID=A0ABV5ZQL7_9PSEU